MRHPSPLVGEGTGVRFSRSWQGARPARRTLAYGLWLKAYGCPPTTTGSCAPPYRAPPSLRLPSPRRLGVSSRGATPLVVVLFAGLLWPGALAAQVTQTVDFEGLPYGTALDQAYQSIGLSIPGARVDTFPRPFSGKQVARIVRTSKSQAFILTLDFAVPQRTVRFYLGGSASEAAFLRGLARGLNDKDSVVSTQSLEQVSKGSCATQVVLRTATPSIRRVQIVLAIYSPAAIAAVALYNPDIAIDQLVFDGLPLPPRQSHVPDLATLTRDQAAARLRDSSLQLGQVDSMMGPGNVGTVIAQVPPPGDTITPGRTVNITLLRANNGKKAPPLTHVPDLSNLPSKLAVRSLADSGLKPGKIGAVLGPGKVGTVFRQSPPPGDTITRGRTVDFILYRADTDKPIPVPNLYGRTQPEADSILRAAHLVLGNVSDGSGPSKPGTIYDQKPRRDSPAKRGDTVSVQIASKPVFPPTVPWWVWAALGAGGLAGATAGARHWRRRLQRRRLKAALKRDSLEWQDSGSPEPGRRAAELRFRVTLDLDDDDRGRSP